MPEFPNSKEEKRQIYQLLCQRRITGNEFYKNASFKDKQGIIWFGGMNGITYFNPQDIINPLKNMEYPDYRLFLHL